MLWIHVIAGTLAVIAGMLAFASRKGGPMHRRSGQVFAAAMLTMTATAVIIAAYLRPNVGNVIAGALTFYLVLTGLLAVRSSVRPIRAWLFGLMLAAFAIGAAAFAAGSAAAARPGGALDGIPAFALWMFASIATLAGLLDARLLRRGAMDARQRLARHLWRMGYAMWVATTSLFLGQARQFPAALRETGLLPVPVLLVTLGLIYWIVRIRLRRFPVPTRQREADGIAARPSAPVPDREALNS